MPLNFVALYLMAFGGGLLFVINQKPRKIEYKAKQYEPDKLKAPTSDRTGAIPVVIGTRIVPSKVIYFKSYDPVNNKYQFEMILALATWQSKSIILNKVWFGKNLIYPNPDIPYRTINYPGTSVIITASDTKDGKKYIDATLAFDDGFQSKFTLPDTGEKISYRGISLLRIYNATLNVGYYLPSIECEVSNFSYHFHSNTALTKQYPQLDCTAVNVLYTILIRFLRLTDDDIDQDSFKTAHEILKTEKNYAHLLIADVEDASDVINNLLTQMDGVLYLNPRDGKTYLKLIRKVDITEDTPIVDESNVIEFIQYSAASWANVVNTVNVIYFDYLDKFKRNILTLKTIFKGRKSATIIYPYCTSKTLAGKLLERDFQKLSKPAAKAYITVTRQLIENLYPGDVILLSWKKYNIVKQRMRIVSIDYGTLEDGKLALDLVEQDEVT